MNSSIEFTDVLAAVDDQVAILSSTGDILFVNEAWQDFCRENGGDTQNFYVGSNYLEICTAQGVAAPPVVAGLRRVLADGIRFRQEYPCHSPQEMRWFELTAAPLRLAGSRGALVQHRNITARHIAQRTAQDNQVASTMLSALVATSNDAILSYDLDGTITTWNTAAQALYGYAAPEITGRHMSLLYPDSETMTLEDYRDRIIAGELSRFEVTRKTKSGALRLIEVSASPVRLPDGEIAAISNIHRDITDLRQAEEKQKIVAQEATHRVKNILTIVNAIQRQTAASADSIEDFTQRFSARIDSLVASTDLLVSGDWTSVPLDQIVRAQLALFLEKGSESVSHAGPAVTLAPAAVQAVGMSLHELATNCAKHGVIAQRRGKVSIEWAFEEGTPGAPLHLYWRETGTGFDRMPAKAGFGHAVLTRLAKTMLDSSSDLTVDETGLTWALVIPPGNYRR